MGCQSAVFLGDNLTFSICTHDADTGALTDASSPPTYRVYEDETAVPVLTGTMAKLDDANSTGLYTAQVACTTANGFEEGKSYTVYVEATVDGVTGGIAYGVGVVTKAGYALSSAGVTAVWAEVMEGTITAVQAMRGILATAIGKLSGAATSTITIRDASDTKNRVVATVDADGNRTAITKDLS
jgi:hypothetical protein